MQSISQRRVMPARSSHSLTSHNNTRSTSRQATACLIATDASQSINNLIFLNSRDPVLEFEFQIINIPADREWQSQFSVKLCQRYDRKFIYFG